VDPPYEERMRIDESVWGGSGRASGRIRRARHSASPIARRRIHGCAVDPPYEVRMRIDESV
jgi:hypothetical protein